MKRQAELNLLAKMLHYPDCWDTAAYPTLKSAAEEVLANWRLFNGFSCSTCATPAPQGELDRFGRTNEEAAADYFSESHPGDSIL